MSYSETDDYPRVILMSATVEADTISEVRFHSSDAETSLIIRIQYFGGCPMLHVPGRIFPVDVFYLEDAVECTGFSVSHDSPYARRCKFQASPARFFT